MATRTKKRRKSSRFRGSHTHGRGGKKKARGSGHRGGFGKAGTGKRADHRKTMVVAGEKYFGKRGVRRARPRVEIPTISLRTIVENIENLIVKKQAFGKDGTYELKLLKYKIIGNDAGKLKLTIHAKAATKGAIVAVKKAGGEITLVGKKTEE